MDGNTAAPGPVRVVPPGEEPMILIPYAKVDRTPAALQHLEGLLVSHLNLDGRLLVSLLGAIEDKGSVALFGQVDEPGHTAFRVFRVVSYDGRTGKFTHASRHDRSQAEHLYDQRREELS